MNALLIVDLQNDFRPGWALPAPEGDKIVAVVNSLLGAFSLVVASKDWHPRKTVHFSDWPEHCIQGTPGAELHPGLMQDRIDQIALTGTGEMDEGYSAFEATNIDLEGFLKERGVDRLFLTGIATEYCVKETALAAVKRGFRTYIVLDAVAGIQLHAGDVEKALSEMRQAGVKTVSSEEVLREVKKTA